MSEAMILPPFTDGQTKRAPTVYFIDDSATMREVIKIAFRRENFNVITCADAASALAQFEQNPPDAVITDAIMPAADPAWPRALADAVSPKPIHPAPAHPVRHGSLSSPMQHPGAPGSAGPNAYGANSTQQDMIIQPSSPASPFSAPPNTSVSLNNA